MSGCKVQYVIVFILFAIFSQLCYGKDNKDYIELKSSPDLFISPNPWKYKTGDNPDWAKFEFNDSAWTSIDKRSRVNTEGVIAWYRIHFNISGEQDETDPLTLLLVGSAQAYEVFWDGILIHQNGLVSSDHAKVVSGRITNFIKLKPQLTQPGFHVLALRELVHTSSLNFKNSRVYIGTFSAANKVIFKLTNLFTFMLGFDLIGFLLSIAFFLMGGRHRSYLFFGLNRLFLMSFCIIEIVTYQLPINMKYRYFLLFSEIFSDQVAYIFLSLFIIFGYKFSKKSIHLIFNIGIFGLLYLIWGERFTNFLIFYPFIMLIWAVKNKETGSLIALIGLSGIISSSILCISFSILSIYHIIWGDVTLVFCALLSISRQIRKQTQEHQASILTSLRLESELVKKYIQPHFIMNTLLSIIALIKKNPLDAIKLIKALAEEFQMVNKISWKKVIPIKEEITLCQKHLKIMSFRRKAQYNLIFDGINPDEKVPPMIFHTLIENGLTHAYQAYENGTFYLNCKKSDHKIRYLLKNDCSRIAIENSVNERPLEEGMGMRYIKARLEESFPGRWELNYGPKNGFWEAQIVINLKS